MQSVNEDTTLWTVEEAFDPDVVIMCCWNWCWIWF